MPLQNKNAKKTLTLEKPKGLISSCKKLLLFE
jgi:hypothetical protein